MEAMTPRARVLAALAHRAPDRIPLDIGGGSNSTLNETAYERLKTHLGVTAETTYFGRRTALVVPDEETAGRLGSAVRPVFLGAPDAWAETWNDDGSVIDEWRVLWRRSGGHFIPVGNPLADASAGDLDAHPWPDPDDPGRLRGLRERARRLHEETGYAVMLGVPGGFVHQCEFLRGFDAFLMDLVADPGFAVRLMDRALDYALRLVANALDQALPYVDVITFGDDIAFQDRLMVRPEVYRRLIKPRHARMVELIRSRTAAPILFHTCGAAAPVIGDLIDIGIDALNPVQVSAAGMGDTALLKREFGAHICFWGGIDTQWVLPFGTPDDVRREVDRRIRDLAVDGGYVAAAVHDIQKDVPPENIVAMADAVRDFAW